MHPVVGVVDASVLLAAMLGEMNKNESEHWLARSCISAVNLAEVIAKLADRGFASDLILESIAEFELDVRPFDEMQAEQAGLMRPATRQFGLSLADRACLALARVTGRPALTADRAWAKLDIDVEVKLVR